MPGSQPQLVDPLTSFLLPVSISFGFLLACLDKNGSLSYLWTSVSVKSGFTFGYWFILYCKFRLENWRLTLSTAFRVKTNAIRNSVDFWVYFYIWLVIDHADIIVLNLSSKNYKMSIFCIIKLFIFIYY